MASILKYIEEYDRPHVEDEYGSTQTSDETEELSQQFESVSMFTFAVIVINFHIEIIRSSVNYYRIYKRNVDPHWESLLRGKQTQTYICYFLLLYSTYLSLYYLYIPSLLWLTIHYVFEMYWRHELLEWYWKWSLYVLKTVIIAYLWTYLYIWRTVDSDILDVYYSKLSTAQQLVVLNRQFFLMALLLYLSSLTLRFCLFKEVVDRRFTELILLLTSFYTNLY